MPELTQQDELDLLWSPLKTPEELMAELDCNFIIPYALLDGE